MYQIRLNKAANENVPERPAMNSGRIVSNKQNHQSNVTVKHYNKNVRANQQSSLINSRISKKNGKLRESQLRRPLLTLGRQEQAIIPERQRGYNLNARRFSSENNYDQRNANASRIGAQISKCANHPMKASEYILYVEADGLYYCCSCAIKLASQGFTVQKIHQTTIKKPEADFPCSPHKLSLLSHYTSQASNQKVAILQSFLSNLNQVQRIHYTRIEELSRVDEIYENRIANVNDFYAELLSFMEQMCDDHIRELESEARRNSQIAFIELDYLQNNIEEMRGIWNDVEANLDDILGRLSLEQFKDSIKFYHNKIHVYEHKVEEMGQFISNVKLEVPDHYQNRLHTVKQFLMSIWNEQNNFNLDPEGEQFCVSKLTCNDSKVEIAKNHHELMIKPAQLLRNKIKTQPSASLAKKQTAFRVLFDSEEQPPLSPRLTQR